MNTATEKTQVDPLAVLRTVSTELEMSARYGGQLSREALFHLSRNAVAAEAAVAELVARLGRLDSEWRTRAVVDNDGTFLICADGLTAALRPFTEGSKS